MGSVLSRNSNLIVFLGSVSEKIWLPQDIVVGEKGLNACLITSMKISPNPNNYDLRLANLG
jgi:hypothetical protein